MVESIYFLKPAWCGTHFAGLWPEQGLQPVTRATAFRRWFVTWLGNRLVNLDHIVHFTVEDDGTRITALLAVTDPKNATITIDGDTAEAVKSALDSIDLGKPVYTFKGISQVVVPMGIGVDSMDISDDGSEGIAEISDSSPAR